jgi:hypothetical protein
MGVSACQGEAAMVLFDRFARACRDSFTNMKAFLLSSSNKQTAYMGYLQLPRRGIVH